KLRALEFGAIPVSRKHSLAQTLSIVHSRITSLISEFLPDVVSMEAVFYAQNVRSAFKLGAVRGVVMLAAESSGVPVVEHSATEIKLAVTGFGRASKESVQKMVKIALRLRETPHPDDASDALAAAICHLNTEKLRAQVKASYEAQSAGRG
nr:crossover junction endodeoxyribonuclease RuvC [Bacillota bacterium]